jgi:hypothetical protein
MDVAMAVAVLAGNSTVEVTTSVGVTEAVGATEEKTLQANNTNIAPINPAKRSNFSFFICSRFFCTAPLHFDSTGYRWQLSFSEI